MRAIQHFISLTVCGSLALSVAVPSISAQAASMTMRQIYQLAKQGKTAELKNSFIDTTDSSGKTALCQAISDNNYSVYRSLISLGANAQHPCTKNIPQAKLNAFNNGYKNWIHMPKSLPSTGLSTGTMVGIGVGAVAVAGVALAAGGGGGGGGGSSNSESGGSIPEDTPSGSSSTILSKYAEGRFLPVINAAQAYEKVLPIQTEGEKIVSYDTSVLTEVRVAVMDTGIYAGNQNVNFAAENGKILQFNYANTLQTHGTSIAGIISGKWNDNPHTINGVAPNAKIVDWMLEENGASLPNNAFPGLTEERLQQVAATNPRIYNLSWRFLGYKNNSNSGYYWASSYNTVPTGETDTNFNLVFNQDGSIFQKFLNHLADTDSVMVLASGNQKKGNNTQLLSAAPLVFNGQNGMKDLTNLVIVAVALDLKEGEISSSADVRGKASYSNGCGVAAAYCLSAPAGNDATDSESTQLYSLGKTTNSAPTLFNGTSAATPVISGSLAFIMGAYPYLKSQDAVEILFRSANKTIIGSDGQTNVFVATDTWTDSLGNKYGISSTFGHGLVDLGAATDILGELSIPISAGASSVGDLNAIAKTAVSKTKLSLPKTLGDNLTLSLPQNIMGLDDYNRPFAIKTAGIVLQAHHSDESFRRHFKSFMNRNKQTVQEGNNKISFRFSSVERDKNPLGMDMIDFQYALNDRNTLIFSYKADTMNQGFSTSPLNPFIDMKNSYSLSEQFQLNKKLSFQLSTTLGKNGFYEGDEDKDEKYNRSVYAFTSEMDYKIQKDLILRLIGGMVTEKEATLGINGKGAFGTENSRTYFTGAQIEYQPISKLSLSAAYYSGKTETPVGNSLITLSDLVSDGFSFDARYDFSKIHLMGLRFSSPLKIKKGYASLRLPYARDMYSDTVYYDTMKLNLKPEAREYDLGFYYQNETNKYLWRGELTARFHPDHRAHVRPDYRALWGLDWKF